MLPDHRIVARHGAIDVLSECQHIVLRDCSVLHLNSVRRHQIDDTFLRAMLYDESHWFVFDLRAIDKHLAVDIPALPRRDTPGLVLHTLRAKFASARDFQAQALCHSVAAWLVPAPLDMTGLAADASSLSTIQPSLKAAA